MRTILVLLHAVPGVLGLVAGLPALVPPRTSDRRRWWRLLYAACIATLLVGMVALIIYDWTDLDTAARAAFVGLLGLGVVVAYRLSRAYRLGRDGGVGGGAESAGWRDSYLSHMYFTYVSLWIGFLVVPAINTPLPQVAVPAVVIGVLGVGHLLLSRWRRRLTGEPAAR